MFPSKMQPFGVSAVVRHSGNDLSISSRSKISTLAKIPDSDNNMALSIFTTRGLTAYVVVPATMDISQMLAVDASLSSPPRIHASRLCLAQPCEHHFVVPSVRCCGIDGVEMKQLKEFVTRGPLPLRTAPIMVMIRCFIFSTVIVLRTVCPKFILA